MKIKFIFLFLFIAIVAAYFGFRKLAPICDFYGGWPVKGNKTLSCECEGKKILIQDRAPEDGFTLTKCLGFVKKTSCTQIAENNSPIACDN